MAINPAYAPEMKDDRANPWAQGAPPAYYGGGPEHNCPLQIENWPRRRKGAKILFSALTIPLPILPLINIGFLIWAIEDVNKNPGDWKDNAKGILWGAFGLDVFIVGLMVIAVIVGLVGMFKKRPGMLQVMSCLLIVFVVLYALSTIGSIASGNWFGMAIGVFMVVWILFLFFYSRMAHMRRIQICRDCY